MTSKNSSANTKSQFYGRKLGRPLSATRKAALKSLLPELEIKLPETGYIAPAKLFSSPPKNLWMEIGFGDGRHLKAIIEQNPGAHFIGAEPFINGMSAFLGSLTPEHLERIKVYMDDAMFLVRALPDQCLDRLYILNPDPWHKKRHHKRRIVNPENLNEFARILKPGADLILSTDVPYLAEWMLTHTFNHPAFEWSATSSKDWKTQPENWITTTYETKRAKGADKMSYLLFKKTLA